VQKVALLCLSTLASGGAEAAGALSRPYASLNSPQQQQQPLVDMVDFLVKVVNPDAWKASLQAGMQPQQQQQQQVGVADAAAAGAEAVLRHLFDRSLMVHLRMLLLTLPPNAPSKTGAEVCVTQMVVRALQLQLLPVKAQQQSSPPAAAADMPMSPTAAFITTDAAAAAAGASMRLGASQLLCVPGLWAKAPSLAPVAGRLCGLVLGELGLLQSSKQLTDVLVQCAAAQSTGTARTSSRKQPQVPTGAAAAAAAEAAAVAVAALTENFVEAAAAGTIFRGLSQADQVSTAGKLVSVLVLLLDAARQLSTLQRRHWRSKLHKQSQQQQSAGRSIYDTGSGVAVNRKAGYVPGAGFVAAKGTADMEVDTPGQGASEPASPAAKSAPAAARAVAAGSAAAGADAAAAMDVDQPPAAAEPPPAAAAAEPAGASGSAAKISKAAAADAAIIEQPVAASAWSAEGQGSSTPAEVTATESCMQLLAGSNKGLQLLRLLVATLLPATTAAEARALRQSAAATQPPPAAAAVLMPGCSVQQQLLELIWGLSRAAEYRQKVWLGLGVGARLVPRLWYSLVLPLHLSTPGGLLYYTGSTSSASSSSSRVSSSDSPEAGYGQPSAGGAGSWVLPMLVLCQAFNAALSFTHIEDFYAAEGASSLVPVTQLYDGAAPAAGLVMLVKAAVWQVSLICLAWAAWIMYILCISSSWGRAARTLASALWQDAGQSCCVAGEPALLAAKCCSKLYSAMYQCKPCNPGLHGSCT
jgi:hypothetical protein